MSGSNALAAPIEALPRVRSRATIGADRHMSMRPTLLNPLFAALTTLPGVGAKVERLYRRLPPPIDRRASPKLRDVVPGTIVTVPVTVDRHRPPPPGRARAPYLVYASDETGDIVLTYFNARREVLEKLLPVGGRRYLSGMTALYDGILQMVHPDRVVDEAGLAHLPLVEPVYPLPEGLPPHQVRGAAEAALAKLPSLPEWQDAAWLSRNRFPSFADAVRALHRPATPQDVAPDSAAWSRLAYDEFLAGQLALALVRAHVRRPGGRASPGGGRLRAKIVAALPYALTRSPTRGPADLR